jgi:hypothetical protein
MPSTSPDKRTLVDRTLDRIKNNRAAAAVIIVCIGLAALASLTDSLKKLYTLVPAPSNVSIDGKWKSEPFELYGSSLQTVVLEVREIAEGRLAGVIRFYDSRENPTSPEYEILQGKRESTKITFSFVGDLKRTPLSGGPMVAVAESISGEVSHSDLKLVYERDGYTPIPLLAHRAKP